MFRLIFVLFLAIVVLAEAFQPRISGGFKTLIEQYPHQISLRSKNNHICGGTILNPKLIITAASCFIKENVNDLSVAAGSDSLDAPQQVLPVLRTRVHEMYSNEYNHDCNVGLLELERGLMFSPTTQPIPLQSHKPEPETPALVAGWGVIVGTGTISRELRAAGLRILHQEDCSASFDGKGYSTERMMCGAVHVAIPMAKHEEAVGPCLGDEGAGLVCTDEMALCGIAWTWNYACGIETNDRAISGYTKINHPDIINWLKRYV